MIRAAYLLVSMNKFKLLVASGYREYANNVDIWNYLFWCLKSTAVEIMQQLTVTVLLAFVRRLKILKTGGRL
jgi:hypothetical protein